MTDETTEGAQVPHDATAASVATAVEMHLNLGQKIEQVASWLFTQLPGVFKDIEAAIAAINAAIEALKKL